MDLGHYEDGMKKIIRNPSKFEIITENICKVSLKFEDQINNFLLKLKNEGNITQNLYNDLHVSGSGPGILYGLPKVHKPNFSLDKLYRPIFAAYKCASYSISKFLVPILQPISENQYTVKNSLDFITQLDGIGDSEKLTMASFDIKDLYTNIPLKETIDICLEKYNLLVTTVPSNAFKKLLELSVFNTIFQFSEKFYKQIDGLGMGLPLSPILANVFLCYHETMWLDNCPQDFKPLFFKRYMDDTFVIFNRPQDVDKFLDYLNAQHPNMIFTHEKEVDRKLPFLDCLVSRENGQFSTSVFRKSTFTGLGLSFFSFMSHIYKINSIKTLLFRAKTISSNHTVLNKEISFLVNYFWQNGYPKSVVYKVIKNFISKLQNSRPLIHTVAKQKLFVSLPFFGMHSERMKNEIIEIIGKIYPQIDLQVALVNGFSIGSLFPYKDRQPKALQSSIIYKF